MCICVCACMHVSKYIQMYLHRHHLRDTSNLGGKLHKNFINLSLDLKTLYILHLNPAFFGQKVYNSATSLRTILMYEKPLGC